MRRIFAILLAVGALAATQLAPVPSRLSAFPGMPAQLAQGTPAVYLPLAVQRVTIEQMLRAAATARAGTAIARTATQAALGSATSTATVVTSATPTVERSPSATASGTGTGTAAPTATTERTPSATHTGGPTAASPTVGPSATPTPTPTEVDRSGERIRPRGAERAGVMEVTFDAARHTYTMAHRSDVTVRYQLDLTHPDNAAGRLAIREAASGRYPVAGAGLYYRRTDGGLVEPRFFGTVGEVINVDDELLTDGVRLTVQEKLEGATHSKRYTLRLVGRSLSVTAQSLDPESRAAGAYAGFSAGEIEGSSDGVNVRVPYMESVPVTMLDHKWFASTLVDFPLSGAGALFARGPEALPGGFINEVATLYLPNSRQRVGPVSETVWVTLSPDVYDVFAMPSNAPSRHFSALVDRVLVTLAGSGANGSFDDGSQYIEQLADWGMTDLIVHKPNWRDPDALRPAQGPADPSAGGAAGLLSLADSAGGWLAVTGAYWVTDEPCQWQANPLYRPADRVLDSDGALKRLTDEAGGRRDCADGTFADRFLLAPDSAARIARDNAPLLAQQGVGALMLGAEAVSNPGYPFPGAQGTHLDEAVATRHPATIGQAVAAYMSLFDALQDVVGPVLAEGSPAEWELGYDSFYAGYLDGGMRPLATGSSDGQSGSSYLVVPDYELSVVRGRMVGYGMGSYERFFGPPTGPSKPLTDAQIDEWRTTALSYGHAGAWTRYFVEPEADTYHLTSAEEAKEYFTMRALQHGLLDARLLRVEYYGADGEPDDLTASLVNDESLVAPRLRIEYAGGLEFWLNHHSDDWSVALGQETILLPQHGWAVRGPEGLWGHSAVIEGRRVDYLWSPEWVVLDGRGVTTRFGTDEARDLKVIFADGRVLEEQPDGSLVLRSG